MVGDILCDYSSSTDEGIAADGVAADDGGIGPQGSAMFDQGGTDLVHLADFRPGIIDIGKDHPFQRSEPQKIEIKAERSKSIFGTGLAGPDTRMDTVNCHLCLLKSGG